MKKFLSIGIMALVCASCQLENSKYGTLSDMWNDNGTQEPKVIEPMVSVEQIRSDKISEPKIVPTPKYASDVERLRQNIVMKVAGENYVVYEYSDVRIDDVASLASAYCYEYSMGKKAYLRDIYMYRNHKRRATFDCVNLASQ
jgi:hypothetical protein